MKNNQVDKLELVGGPYQRGKIYGKEKKEVIESFIEYLYPRFKAWGESKEEILSKVKMYIPYIEDYSTEISEEIKGVAEGAEVPYKELALISLREDIITTSNTSPDNCTAFAATGSFTEGSQTYLGQSWDTNVEFYEKADPVLLELIRSSGPNCLVYDSTAGTIADAGLNSAGLGIVWNSVPRLSLKIGVPTYVIVRKVLQQSTIGEALNVILNAERAGCFNFVLADETEIYDVEATPEEVDIKYSGTHTFHANHFISRKFSAAQDLTELCKDNSASSLVRHNRMGRLLKEEKGNIDMETCKNFLRDHMGYPQSICRHPESGNITSASWVISTKSREIWISLGPPCESDFHHYTFNKKSES